MSIERLQKILARGGVASRRAAEEMITAGRVRVNGHVVTELGVKADPRVDRIDVDNKRVIAEDFVYLVLHKPRGVVTTLDDPEGRPSVKDLVKGVNARIFPVGRLDFDTSGVLILTNDGEFSNGLLHPRKGVPKEYVVKTQGAMEERDLDLWRKGVRLEDGVTLPADVNLIRHEAGKTWLSVVITEGRNHQIRRMGEATRFIVMRLARVSFAGITIEGLPPGKFRPMTRDELRDLKKNYGVPKSLPREAEIDTRRHQGRAVRADAHGRVDANSTGRTRGRSDSKTRGRTDPRAEPTKGRPAPRGTEPVTKARRPAGGGRSGTGGGGSSRGPGGSGPRGSSGGGTRGRHGK